MLKRKLNEMHYRLKVRKELGNLDAELLAITYDECKKEIDRRNKKKQ